MNGDWRTRDAPLFCHRSLLSSRFSAFDLWDISINGGRAVHVGGDISGSLGSSEKGGGSEMLVFSSGESGVYR